MMYEKMAIQTEPREIIRNIICSVSIYVMRLQNARVICPANLTRALPASTCKNAAIRGASVIEIGMSFSNVRLVAP